MAGCVAAIAGETGMLALEHVSGLFMVEGSEVPFDKGKFAPIVFGMAASATLARSDHQPITSVEALVCSQSFGNLRMAIEALEGGLTAA